MVDYSNSSESFYDGASSSLDPMGENFTGYKMSAGQIGFPGSPMTANQVGETVSAIKQGTKVFEVSLLGMEQADETIPKQHFKEIKALMKLSGVKPSVHGPLVDAAGFGGQQQGQWGGEEIRIEGERKMLKAIEDAHTIDDKGGIPIVFHAANGAPGTTFRPKKGSKPGEEGRFEASQAFIIDRETGQMKGGMDLKKSYYPGRSEDLVLGENWKEEGGKIMTFGEQIRSANVNDWDNKMTDLATFNKHAQEIISRTGIIIPEHQNAQMITTEGGKYLFADSKTGKMISEASAEDVAGYENLRQADIFLENVQQNFGAAFNKAWQYGSDKQREELKELSEDYKEDLGKINPRNINSPIKKQSILNKSIQGLSMITSERGIKNNPHKADSNYGAPKVYVDSRDFVKEKASDTFGNVAFESYKKYGEDAPVIAIENPPEGMGFSNADELKELIEISRKNFAQKLVEEKKMGKKQADKIAKKQLGVTWDVGHINMMRKRGFEEKDIVEATKKIQPFVKHIHLTDNFGFGDTHLAPGMGNVPIKGILEELEKNEDFEGMRKIVEAGGFVKNFKASPHPMALSAFGSPIYGAKSQSSWQENVSGNYFAGYGMSNPSIHHGMYGAGFTTLPLELGGSMPGAGGDRFAGRGMA